MNSTSQKNYTLPIIMMVALFFMISFVTGLQNPFGVIVKNQFQATNLMSQLGNAANFIAYAFMGVPAGMLLQKIGYKKTALLAIIVGFVGVFISYLSGLAGSYAVYLTGAFVSGFSMCMLNTVVNPMLNTLGGGGNKGNQLIQVAGSVNSIGATISDAAPALFLAMGIFALAFIVLISMNIPEPSLERQQKNTGAPDKYSAFSFRHFILGTIAIFIYVGVEVGIPNFMNLFATSDELGIDPTTAGSLVGTYWFLMMVGRLCGASLGARFSSKSMLTLASAVGLVFILIAIFAPITTKVSMPVFLASLSFGMVEVPIGIMFLALCGLCTSIMWGGIFNLAVEGLGKYTEAASGFFMVMVCGGGILPLIQGVVADMAGFQVSYFVILFGLAYLLYYALVGSKNVNKDIPVE